MTTLIVPCGGKSSRFPNMKPKWLLTHPDGKLMIEKAIGCLPLNSFDRVIITIINRHEEMYEASLILKQAFKHLKNFQICILQEPTSCVAETVYRTIIDMNVSNGFVVKDSDNFVIYDPKESNDNYVVYFDISKHPDVNNIPGKSFIKTNEQDIILDVVEKKIISDMICLGVYSFADAEYFKKIYEEMRNLTLEGELYLSQVISYMIDEDNYLFHAIEATQYNDWGTFNEWRTIQNRMATYFCDIDGVLFVNRGKYGKLNWTNDAELLSKNIETIKRLQDNGAQIIITTSRTKEFKNKLKSILADRGIYPYDFVMGLNHAPRIIINDFANSNPFPSCKAISIPRNGDLTEYLK